MNTSQISTACYVVLGGYTVLMNFAPPPTMVNISLFSILIIVIECFKSVNQMMKDYIEVSEEEETLKKEGKIQEHMDSEMSRVEVLTSDEAYKFPIVGSCMLGGLYLLIKSFGKKVVNYVLLVYFVFVGAQSAGDLIFEFSSRESKKKWEKMNQNIVFKSPKVLSFEFELSQFDLLCGLLSLVLALLYVFTAHWLTNNLIGIMFCIFAIQNVYMGNFKIGAGLLFGLFFYDIFWVFGTDVMETVAKNIDGPIKLLFPRKAWPGPKDLNLLGLGDIVIPGMYMSLCLRYDVITFYNKLKEGAEVKRDPQSTKAMFDSTPKVYFWASVIGYVLGMLVTVSVMLFFQAGQPALLYLVPGCVGSTLLTSFMRNEFSQIFQFKEDIDMEEMRKDKMDYLGVVEKVEEEPKKEK